MTHCDVTDILWKKQFGSLATNKTKPWLSPSAKQCWNPCCGPQLVCTRIWVRTMVGLLKSHCQFVNQNERKFETHFRKIIKSVRGPEQGYWCCFADVTNLGYIICQSVLRQSVCVTDKISVHVEVNFLFQVSFVFLLFLGMVIYANEVETKEK